MWIINFVKMSTLVNFIFWEAAKTWGHAILGSTIRKAVFQCGGGCGCNELGYQPKKPTRRLRVASGISYDIINIDKKLIARIFFLSYEILLFFSPKIQKFVFSSLTNEIYFNFKNYNFDHYQNDFSWNWKKKFPPCQIYNIDL